MDKQFEKNANEGYILLKRTYNACTEIREIYYDENYAFVFPRMRWKNALVNLMATRRI